jgi:hypothetical protein
VRVDQENVSRSQLAHVEAVDPFHTLRLLSLLHRGLPYPPAGRLTPSEVARFVPTIQRLVVAGMSAVAEGNERENLPASRKFCIAT